MKFLGSLANNKKIAAAGLVLKKHWSDICLVLGIGCGAGACIATGVQTARLDPLLDDHKRRMDEVRGKDIPEGERKKQTAVNYAKTCGKMAKHYAVPAALEAVSIATQISGHHTLKAENLVLAGALTAATQEIRKLRTADKVADAEKLGASVVQDENSGEKEVVLDPGQTLSMYARIFDCGNKYWSENPEDNVAFLRRQQVRANDLLKAKGYLFLNEVFELIGIDRCRMGQVVGWVDGMGDSYIDFGILAIRNKNAIDGYEPAIWLDFNVDGDIMYIFDKMHGGDGKNLYGQMN